MESSKGNSSVTRKAEEGLGLLSRASKDLSPESWGVHPRTAAEWFATRARLNKAAKGLLMWAYVQAFEQNPWAFYLNGKS